MSRLLALDLGKRRTGVAFGDDDEQFVVALSTLHHQSVEDLAGAVAAMAQQRKIERLVIGLPLLLDGTEGEQALWTREAARTIGEKTALPVSFIDERFTSLHADANRTDDTDARAACALLDMALRQSTHRQQERNTKHQ